MKKTFLALACALILGQSMVAQSEDTVVLTEDPTQGVVENRFRDNWFVGAGGGISFLFNHAKQNVQFEDATALTTQITAGKWFSPLAGARFNLDWYQSRAQYRMNNIGITGDGLLNLTNWWCGYRPDRTFNSSFYVGAGLYKRYKREGSDSFEPIKAPIIVGRMGFLNTFRLNNHLQFYIDARLVGADRSMIDYPVGSASLGGQILVGFNYNFNNATWHAPMVPVCPEPENCDALRARLQAADARIADLEAQLQACLNRPVEKAVVNVAPLATIYFPINSYTINRSDRRVLSAIANIMKSTPTQGYVVTGYADNYTGTDAYNVRLRHNRANAVQKQLVRNGVPASQLETTINNENLNPNGIKFVALDRCVTITEKK